MPVIGYLIEGQRIDEHLLAAFLQGLAEAGYMEGKNTAIEYRLVTKPDLFPQAADDLVRLNVNVIAAITPGAVPAARNATTSIPIVALDLESDPLAKGYVKSLARPGGNMTGMFLDLPEFQHWGLSIRGWVSAFLLGAMLVACVTIRPPMLILAQRVSSHMS